MRAVAGAALLLVAGCGAADDRTAVTVFAAASLTESFSAVEAAFEADNPGLDVRLNFAGSSTLARQISAGAEIDVFASADEATMAAVADRVDGSAVAFATNRLTIVTPPDDPAGVTGLADLARDDVVTVVCAPQVPCGAAAGRAAEAAGVTLAPASEEQDAKAVLTKVVSGEADAGLVYLTDARSAGDGVAVVDFPESGRAVNTYSIAVLDRAPQPGAARRFVDAVLGENGQAELAEVGFGRP